MFIGSSLWLTLRSFCSYSNEQIDKLIVGKREGASVLGAYSIADQMAQMPSSELIGPMARALFPAYASIKDDTDRLKRAFLLALGVQATIGLPAGIGLALVSSEATSLILSEKWRFAAPFMAVLACTYSLHAIVNSSGYLLLATGRFRENSLIHATVLVSFLVIVIFLAPEMHAFDIALTRLASGFFSLSLFVGFAVRQLGQGTVRAIASVLFRPIIATSIMALSIFGFADELNALENLPRFIAKVTIGVFGYLTSLLGLWVLQRRPFGAERWILTLVFSRWKST